MNFPLISEYIDAIRLAEDNFNKLSNLRPVLDGNGNPIMSSGNFAVVFKMKDVNDGRYYAVKCFLKEQEGRNERYQEIAEELKYNTSSYLLNIRYIEDELFVWSDSLEEGNNVPVVVMDWVDGRTLDTYIKERIHSKYTLATLAYNFCRMGSWLLSQPIAHGDLKPDNIIVREDGSLVLVDYDGMYVPELNEEFAIEMGTPNFRHPMRDEFKFDEHIDDFSIAEIALSLKAISLNPQLYKQFGSSECFLFSDNDYRDIAKSDIFNSIVSLATDKGLSSLLSLFLLALANGDLSMVSNKAIIIDKPEKLSIIPKDNIPLEIEHDYSVGVTVAEFYTEREIERGERKWTIIEFQDEYGDLYNALALTNGTVTKNSKRGRTYFILCKEQQEEGYVLDKDFVKDNRIYILLITPEDINKKYGSDYRFGIIWLDKPSIDDWDDWK